MFQQTVVAAVEGVFLGEAEVSAQQVGHGAVVEPVAVQPPLAAGIDVSVADQGFEHGEPVGAFAADAGAGREKLIEPEPAAEVQRDPAGSPLSRIMQREGAQFDLDNGVGIDSRGALRFGMIRDRG